MKSIFPQALASVFLDYRSLRGLFCALFLSCALAYTSPAQTPAQTTAPKPPLHIAAAADLQPVFPELARQYETQTGVPLIPSFGSSATLTQQIQNGSPADLFLSADCAHPQQLTDAKLTLEPQPVLYARGILVLWARHDSPAQPLSLASLTSSRTTRIALANDQHAPYGQAATAELRALKLYDQLAPKLVTGENILQTAQFAQTGNADAAFLSLTLADSPLYGQTGSYIPLPALYPPIRQCGVALRRGSNHAAAEAFLHWLVSPPIQHQLPQFGLTPAR